MEPLVLILSQRSYKLGSRVCTLLQFRIWLDVLNSVIANYDTAMKVVAYTELVIFVRVFLGAITFQNALIAPLIYAHFLRQRYYQSAFTRDAVAKTTGRLDQYVAKANNPSVNQIYDKIKMLVQRWVGSSIIEPQPNPQAARR